MTPPPKWYELAVRELGVKATSPDNPVVMRYYADAGHPEVEHDSLSWCAAFVGAMLRRANVQPSGSLMARSYLNWGKKLSSPRVGCVVVCARNEVNADESILGHVFFFAGSPHMGLGGNQTGHMVCIEPYAEARVLGFRWPHE